MKSTTEKRSIFGWAMYDWANSAYMTTIAVAVLPMYFASVVVGSEGFTIAGTLYAPETLWGFMISASAFLVFLMAPTLGAIADFCSAKKRFLFVFCYLGVTGSIALSFCGEGNVYQTMLLFIISQIGFVGANVFYDAFLPQIASQGQEDRISSKGFAYGYAGGGIQFAFALVLIAMHDTFGISQSTAARIAMLTAALWWGLFALFTFFLLKERTFTQSPPEKFTGSSRGVNYLYIGIMRVVKTMKKVRKRPHLLLFLISFLVYNEGIQTVIQMATIYGKQELKFGATTLMLTLLLVQFVAIFGALLFGWLAKKTGTKQSVMCTLVVWSGVVIYAYFIQSPVEYFILGAIVGLVMGGSQAISRSFYASMIPIDSPAEYFGFYSIINKFSAVWGPFIFAIIRHFSGSSRNAIVSLIIFFILGIILLFFVDEEKARENRGL